MKEKHEEKHHEVEGAIISETNKHFESRGVRLQGKHLKVLPECFVSWPKPADERGWRENGPVQQSQAKSLTLIILVAEQVDEANDHVGEQQTDMGDPQIVQISHDALELYRNVDVDVLVETWLERTE